MDRAVALVAIGSGIIGVKGVVVVEGRLVAGRVRGTQVDNPTCGQEWSRKERVTQPADKPRECIEKDPSGALAADKSDTLTNKHTRTHTRAHTHTHTHAHNKGPTACAPEGFAGNAVLLLAAVVAAAAGAGAAVGGFQCFRAASTASISRRDVTASRKQGVCTSAASTAFM